MTDNYSVAWKGWYEKKPVITIPSMLIEQMAGLSKSDQNILIEMWVKIHIDWFAEWRHVKGGIKVKTRWRNDWVFITLEVPDDESSTSN